VLAVADDSFQYWSQLRLAYGFFVPLRKYRGRDLNVLAQLIGGMSAQKKAVEKCGFALRELEVLQPLL